VDDRLLDVTGAIRYLESLPYVKPGVGAVGLSQGGSVVLAALGWKRSKFRKNVLAAGIALYPGCTGGIRLRLPTFLYAPTLILIGSADNITLAAKCESFVENLKVRSRSGNNLDESPQRYISELVVYPGVHHSYDLPLRRTETTPVGTVAPDYRATKDSRKRIIAFFRNHLGSD
jgi:dienelactone hydrolase